MEIKRSNSTKINDVNFNSIKFGEISTDHMFECNFKNGQWESPVIIIYIIFIRGELFISCQNIYLVVF